MAKHNLPTYAIVELLIRLAHYDESIGDYKDHAICDDDVIVKTSTGTILFPQELVLKQFELPESITEAELHDAVAGFNPIN
ncbi:MAG TPA: hypothetical protein VG367_06545 [Mucilaginibacter sp.]|jgi:hypothetical protein|nr:hypothetical protein [Mucilaginibacter sp.]